jgi:hypothetical protein
MVEAQTPWVGKQQKTNNFISPGRGKAVFRTLHLFPLPHRPQEHRVHGYEHRYQ